MSCGTDLGVFLAAADLLPRANCVNWELPVSDGLPGRIIWREPGQQRLALR